MSNDIEHYTDPQDSAVALYLTNNDGEELTNVLVAALEDAFRILRDEVSGETMH
ncbi:UNVERIFIED_ORG: phosphorylcholine metabolism protein LicD [Ensifer adhaerens]|nr:phosphorylcholine metabolism protein LicD [Ensifer adhaerens]